MDVYPPGYRASDLGVTNLTKIFIIYECTLLHRIYRRRIRSALYERPRGQFRYNLDMCNIGKMESARKCFDLDMQESTLRGDAVLGWTQSLSETKSAGMGCCPHYFPRRESPEPIALFPMVRASMLFRQVLAYVMEVRRGLNRGRIEAHCSSNNRRDKTTSNYNIPTSTVQLILGDACWTEVNPFRGKREIESQWDEEDYEITRQVANGPSSYETKCSSGRVKAPHRDGFF